MPQLQLISFDACPFVQRAAILLKEQGRAYDLRYIDLASKPDWFLAISPRGKVPVLEVEGTPIFESAVILEYLDETAAEEDRLLPSDALGRAQQRMWISYISDIMGAGWRFQAAKTEEDANAIAEQLRSNFAELSKNIHPEGPLWNGDSLSMVDVAIAPIFQRFAWAETLEPSIQLFEELPRIAKWRDALLSRPTLTSSIVDDLETRSGKMLKGLGSWVARNAE